MPAGEHVIETGNPSSRIAFERSFRNLCRQQMLDSRLDGLCIAFRHLAESNRPLLSGGIGELNLWATIRSADDASHLLASCRETSVFDFIVTNREYFGGEVRLGVRVREFSEYVRVNESLDVCFCRGVGDA